MKYSADIDQIVQEILADMPQKEKVLITNLDEDKYLLYLYSLFDVSINSKLGQEDEIHRV